VFRLDGGEFTDDNGSYRYTETFMGLNIVLTGLRGPDGTPIPNLSGRGEVLISLTFDENGNIIDFTFGDTSTPHLAHLLNNDDIDAIVCETLAQ
jgi:hypothetical protein